MQFSLSDISGFMNKTVSKLMHRLEKYQHIDEEQDTNTSKPQVDVAIYDAIVLLHTLKLLETYGGRTYKLLKVAFHSTPAKEVHVLFDTYGYKTIKDCERDRRSTVPTANITVTGADQKTPKKACDAFRNEQFQTSMIFGGGGKNEKKKNLKYASLLRDKVLYLGVETKCCKDICKEGNVEVFELLDLACHQEADTRIIRHIHYTSLKGGI